MKWLILLIGVMMGDQFAVAERITRAALLPCHWPLLDAVPEDDDDLALFYQQDAGDDEFVIVSDDIDTLTPARETIGRKGGTDYEYARIGSTVSPVWWLWDDEEKAWFAELNTGPTGNPVETRFENVTAFDPQSGRSGTLNDAPPPEKYFKKVIFNIRFQMGPAIDTGWPYLRAYVNFRDSSGTFTVTRTVTLFFRNTTPFSTNPDVEIAFDEPESDTDTGWMKITATVPDDMKHDQLVLREIGFLLNTAFMLEVDGAPSNFTIRAWVRCVKFVYEKIEEE